MKTALRIAIIAIIAIITIGYAPVWIPVILITIGYYVAGTAILVGGAFAKWLAGIDE